MIQQLNRIPTHNLLQVIEARIVNPGHGCPSDDYASETLAEALVREIDALATAANMPEIAAKARALAFLLAYAEICERHIDSGLYIMNRILEGERIQYPDGTPFRVGREHVVLMIE